VEARAQIADFLGALLFVYTLCILGYIITQFVFAFGARVPYSRPLNGLMNFLRDVSEPYLRIFRPLPLRFGPIDFTPIVALFVLRLVGGLVIGLVDPGP
jgi:uncharacterized protein YggT (Ycf19 family)